MDDKSIVSVKIMDVDSADYKLSVQEKDQALKDFAMETSILNSLKASQARNINIMLSAFPFYSQLWIVTEYCPGGSVHTLMKAWDNNRLDEKHIIIIARELAIAVNCVHNAGIIHRDIKAANVLIREDGQVQLCDFGVAAVLESTISKRQTFIGTPFWMAPEMYSPESMHDAGGYGVEVDIWAYGCTIFEMATGKAPNTNINPQKLHLFLKKAPRLDDKHSEALQAFVAFVLKQEAHLRPSANDILGNPFLEGSERRYPTSMLKELVEHYTVWEMSGGERASLFNAFGAQAPEDLPGFGQDDDDWNFSFTDELGAEVAEVVSHMQEIEMTSHEKVFRGDRKLGRIFDVNHHRFYNHGENGEDDDDDDELPLRVDFEMSKMRQSVIDLDLDAGGDELQLDFDAAPARANRESVGNFYGDYEEEQPKDDDFYGDNPYVDEKRATAEWTFATAKDIAGGDINWDFPSDVIEQPKRATGDWQDKRKTTEWSWETAQLINDDDEGPRSFDETLSSPPADPGADALAPAIRPQLKHTATAPVGESLLKLNNPREKNQSIDLDMAFSGIDDVIVENVGEEPQPTHEHTTESFDDSFVSYDSRNDDSFVSYDSRNDDPFGIDDGTSTEPTHVSQQSLDGQTLAVSEPSFDVEIDEEPRTLARKTILQRQGMLEEAAPSLSRAPSVKASMDTLRRNPDEDDDDEESTATDTLTQKRTGRGGSGPQPSQLQHRQAADPNATARRTNAPPSLTVDTSTMKRSKKSSSGSYPQHRNKPSSEKTLRNPKKMIAELPDIQYVDPGALADGASKEVQAAELKRLLAGLSANLDVCSALLDVSKRNDEKKVRRSARSRV